MEKIKLDEVGDRAKPGPSIVSCPLPVGLATLRLVVLTVVLIQFAGVAGAATNNVAPLLPPDANPLQALCNGLAGNYGWLTTVVLVIGSLRIVFKPIMLALENYVRQTPTVADDERLAKFEAGIIYKALAFLLDFAASIKLPKSDNGQPK